VSSNKVGHVVEGGVGYIDYIFRTKQTKHRQIYFAALSILFHQPLSFPSPPSSFQSSQSSAQSTAWQLIESQAANPNNLSCQVCQSKNCQEEDLGKSGHASSSAKVETWGRKDEHVVVRMKCNSCGALWDAS
jgi:hypothetical protein